jgi:serine/threonine-protein kinase
MAPEQAKGRAVDRRADIWAFGCVLYEMLTGTRVFEGEDVSETLASVLRADVDWSALPKDVPLPVVDLLRRCLERDLRQRLQAIGEARILLGRASGESASSVMARSNAGAPAPVPARGRSWMWLAVGALAGALAAIAAMQPWRAQAGPTAVRRFLIPTDVAPDNIALSPDGRRVLFAANNKLLVREIDALQPREIPGVTITGGTDPAAPAWSPDGQSIVYGGEGKIWRVNAAGGAPSVICDLPGVYRGAAWKPDGTILISVTRGPMYQVSANGGEPRVLIPLDGKDDVDFHDPFVLPDGQSLLYSVHRRQGVDTIEALSGGQRKVLMRLEGRALEGPQVLNTPVYAPSGHLLYRLEQGNAGVWAVPFSLSTLTTAGEPFLVAAGGTRPTVATDGTLAYVAAGTGGPRQLAWFRPDGTLERTAGEPRKLLRKPWLSPDGRRVVFLADELNTDVWVSNVDGSGATRITFTPGNEEDPSWIPGQNAVAFTCPKAGGGAICSKNADGSGDVKVIAEQAGDAVFTSDGNAVLYSTSGQARRGLLSLDLRTPGAQPKEFAMGAEQLYPIGIVGGNKFGIFWGFSSGRPNATVKPFPAGDAKWELGSPVDDFPKLLPGGTALGWLQPRPDGTFALIGVPFETSPSVTAGQPRELFKNLPSTLEPDGSFDVSADGKHLLAVIKKSTGPAQRGIVVVLDWASEFRKK